MKKLLLSLFILLLIGFTANKAHSQKKIIWGLHGGINFSSINGEDVDTRTGLMIGAYLQLPITNSHFAVQPEVLYTQKGFELGNEITVRLDYLEIPILANFNVATKSKLIPFFYFGPYVGFNVNAERDGRKTIALDDIPPNVPTEDLNENVRETELGLIAGAGININQLNFGVRYTAGLTETFEDRTGNGKNGVFSIIAGIGF